MMKWRTQRGGSRCVGPLFSRATYRGWFSLANYRDISGFRAMRRKRMRKTDALS